MPRPVGNMGLSLSYRLYTMHFTQVAVTAALAAAVIAAPVPKDDLTINLIHGFRVTKHEEAVEDLGIRLGLGDGTNVT